MRLIVVLDRVFLEADTADLMVKEMVEVMAAFPPLDLFPEGLGYLFEERSPRLVGVVGAPSADVQEEAWAACRKILAGGVTTAPEGWFGLVIAAGSHRVGALFVHPRRQEGALVGWQETLLRCAARATRAIDRVHAVEDAQRRPPIPARTVEGADRSPIVLVVDDDGPTRRALRRNMVRRGWTAIEAENGEIGLQLLERGLPDVILLDLNMPKMDGFEFLAQLRSRPEWTALPVVVVTAKALGDRDCIRLQRGYVDQVVHKEAYSGDALLDAVGRLARAAYEYPVS